MEGAERPPGAVSERCCPWTCWSGQPASELPLTRCGRPLHSIVVTPGCSLRMSHRIFGRADFFQDIFALTFLLCGWPTGCFTRRSLPPIYIRGTRPPPTADETDTESEPEDRAEAETALAESNHSIRPETEREQEDRDEIESDHFIQASPHDSGWVVG